MFSSTAVLLVFAMLQLQSTSIVVGNLFKSINTGLEGIRRNHCLQLRRSSANVQFPWYCKPGRLSVIYVHVGPGWVKTNRFSYTGAVQRNADVKFMTEQDGGGQILAKFNSAILNCQGFSALKRKTCTIPRALRPWSGTITVEIGRHPSTRFQMSGTPVCLKPGFEGYNCDQDINECVVHKDKRLCAWKEGCVNTYGGYKCKCPAGYKVSSKDFRLCDKDIPKILSRSSNYTFIMFQTATLPCRYSASSPVTIKWQINNKIIAIKQLNGAKQTADSRLTLHDNGDLSIRKVTYGDAGKFICVVQNVRFGAYITHNLNIESSPLMAVQFLVSGKHTTSHVYRVGDDVTIDCQVIAMPVPTVTLSYGQQMITTTARTKVILGKLPNSPVSHLPGSLQLQLRITGVTQADAGIYSCQAKNRHGVTTKSIKLTVTL
ncbi:cell adhesion [Desmophyllum pertusum]|uniref:Cell adhesion n=1 Tax=Desmophyllum pertusum TaxID=174260 RepID=A0A9W9Z3R4_9CNID|nr:cell adhesion [Desmophyllum pertusum]